MRLVFSVHTGLFWKCLVKCELNIQSITDVAAFVSTVLVANQMLLILGVVSPDM